MTVTSPTRPRAATLLRIAALAAGVLLVFAMGRTPEAQAIAEDTVTFTVTQSPAAPTTVQVGSAVVFTVTASATSGTALLLDFSYPPGLSFVSGASSPAGVTCQNNSPDVGVVRCNYTTVGAGNLVPVTLNFTINSTTTTTASQFVLRNSVADADADSAADGADSMVGAGQLATFGPGLISASGSSAPELFEGAQTQYVTTITNSSGVSTGVFSASTGFTNASVLGGSCLTNASPNGTFTPGGGTGTCAGSVLADGETLTIQATIQATNTASGADIVPTITSQPLGISAQQTVVAVHEVGLENTGAALGTGTPVNVCTNAVAGDVVDDAAAGAAQPNNGLILLGSPSQQPVMATTDFSVTGPGVGSVSAATGCGSNQSGVRFTPSTAGTYVITANYNTGGTNVLTLEVPGPGAPIATNLAFTTQPTGGVNSGVALPQQPVVAVRTAGGATVTTDNTTQVSLAISGSGVLTCDAGLTRTVSSGVATFTGCSVTPAGSYTITASSSPVLTPAVSASFTINAPATKLTFTTQPGNGVANQNLASQPVVTVQTAANATVTTDNSTQVTLAISDGATLTCDGGLTKTVTAGVATFTGCKVASAGTDFTIMATSSPSLTAATSAAFDVTAAPPTTSAQLVVQTPTAGAVARSRLTFRVATGTLAPTEVRFIVRRTSDNHYWNATTGAWQAGSILNLGANAGSGNFTLAVTGEDRRDFVNTSVTVEVRATVGSITYVNTTIPTVPIR